MVAAVLKRPTLVLNRNWQPIGVASVSRAMVMVWSDTARFVDPADYSLYNWDDWSRLKPRDGEPVVKTVSFDIRVPEVITLTRYDRMHRRTVPFTRRNLFRRDRFTCQYCFASPGGNELTIDHVLPKSRGGTTALGQLRAGLRALQPPQGRPHCRRRSACRSAETARPTEPGTRSTPPGTSASKAGNAS